MGNKFFKVRGSWLNIENWTMIIAVYKVRLKTHDIQGGLMMKKN